MKILLSCRIALASLAALPANTPPGYTITGTVTGLPDSTWLYLMVTTPQRCIDSCQVIHGSFTMNGRIPEKATEVWLHTKRFTNYVKFWLENDPITITIQANAFKKALISGSAIQEEQNELNTAFTTMNKQADSLSRLLKTTADTLLQQKIRLQRSSLKDELLLNWTRSHPNSLVTANLINLEASLLGREKTKTLYNYLSPEMKATSYGLAIDEFIALNQNVQIGDRYTDFEEPNTKGETVKLSQIKGKYILLEFWSSWCDGCRQQNPALVGTYGRFKEKGFTILGVSLDESKADWSDAIVKDQLPWENVSDLRGSKNKAALIYGITAIPGNFLIDENGIIIAKDLRGKDLDDKLDQLLP